MNFALLKRQRVWHPTSLSKTRLSKPARLIPCGPAGTVSMSQSPAAVASPFSNPNRSECCPPMCALHRGAFKPTGAWVRVRLAASGRRD